MPADRYRSFTTASLLLNESSQVASLYVETPDWNQLRETVLSQNLLQSRTLGTRNRVWNEVSSRLRLLNQRELDLLANGTPQEQGYLLWVAVCRRYALIRDFAIEVVRERHLALASHLRPEDFDRFFNQKADWHPELERMATDTRRRLRPMLFKMMRQAGLLTPDDRIIPTALSPRLVAAVSETSRDDLAVFPSLTP